MACVVRHARLAKPIPATPIAESDHPITMQCALDKLTIQLSQVFQGWAESFLEWTTLTTSLEPYFHQLDSLYAEEQFEAALNLKVRLDASWQVAKAPADLIDRKVEITGPVETKMMINAFNSGANVFMADFEDALSPTWENVVEGQWNLIEAVQGKLTFESGEGKVYKLKEKIATLMVRPRGWHLIEKHFLIDGQPISASLFDFGLFFFHNAAKLLQKGSGPYFYLPKLENHLEAKLWNDVFLFAQKQLGIAVGSIRATVLIETIPAA